MNFMLFRKLSYSKLALLLLASFMSVMCCLPLKHLRSFLINEWENHSLDVGVNKKCSVYPSYTWYLKVNDTEKSPVFDISFTYLPSCSRSVGQLEVNFIKPPYYEV